jgi:hypothetical protein
MIARSKDVSNPAAVQISTELKPTTKRGPDGNPLPLQVNVVTLRGTAKNYDESRTIESMVRLTAGVGGVVNELKFPTRTAP